MRFTAAHTASLAGVACIGLFMLAKSLAQAPVVCPSAPGVWETRAPLPIAATEVASAAIGDKVYVLGGILPSGASSNRLFIYDPLADTWSEGPPLPISGGVNHANVAASDLLPPADGVPELYMLGALLSDGQPTGRSFVYEVPTNAWREISPMPTARGAAGIAASDRIYVVGGLIRSGNNVISGNQLEAYFPPTGIWTIFPPMPTPRDHLTAQVSCPGLPASACDVSGFIALAGRRDGVLVNATEYLDLRSSPPWSTRAPIPTPRAGLGSAVVNQIVYVMGGEGSAQPSGTFGENESFNSLTNGWCSVAPMPTPRHGFYAAALPGVGGDPGPAFTVAGGPQAGAFFSQVNEVFFPPPEAQAVVGSGGIVNAASYGREIAGGSIVSLFGTNLTYRPVGQPRLPLPTQFNGTRVLVNGAAVPLLHASPQQINFILPPGTTSPATIIINKGGQDFPQQDTVQVLGAAPGIFSVDGTGRGQGAILHANTGQLAGAARPARAGDALEIYLTGLLDCAPGQVCIQVAPDVTIGGVRAPLLFYGRAPGFAGLNQINVRVPPGIAPSPAAPVVVSHASPPSNTVTVAIQ